MNYNSKKMKIAIIGAGAMGGSFAEGLLKGCIFNPSDVTIANPHEDKLKRFSDLGANTTTNNIEAIKDADIITIVVKPWLVEQVVDDIKDSIDYNHQIIINMAAAIKADTLFDWFDKDGQKPVLFQVIPNIAIAQKASMTFIVPCGVSNEQTAIVKEIFDDLGKSLITDEAHLGAGTTLASCGIAYAMRYVRAASEGGVELGFKADIAKEIVLQTMKGAVELLQATGLHPEAAIDQVTTPGGLTIKGLNTMEKNGFSNAVIEGLKAGIK